MVTNTSKPRRYLGYGLFLITALSMPLELWAAPTADAGPETETTFLDTDDDNDPTTALVAVLNLNGSATGTSGTVTFLWSLVSGPDLVVFQDQEDNLTSITLSRTGTYIVRFRVTDDTGTDTDLITIVVGPETVNVVVSRALYQATGAGNPKSKVTFTMSGVNTGDKKLDLRSGDRFAVRFGGVAVGSLTGNAPDQDFVRMDFKNRPRPTTERGQTFDSTNAKFKKVRVRYSSKGPGKMIFTASGGDFDSALLPQANAGQQNITIDVVVERPEYNETVQFVFTQVVSVAAESTRKGIKGKLSRE